MVTRIALTASYTVLGYALKRAGIIKYDDGKVMMKFVVAGLGISCLRPRPRPRPRPQTPSPNPVPVPNHRARLVKAHPLMTASVGPM
jgi:hypothetical protein